MAESKVLSYSQMASTARAGAGRPGAGRAVVGRAGVGRAEPGRAGGRVLQCLLGFTHVHQGSAYWASSSTRAGSWVGSGETRTGTHFAMTQDC